jgi:hypothetical protein
MSCVGGATMTRKVYSSLTMPYRTFDEGPATDFSAWRVQGRRRGSHEPSEVAPPLSAESYRSLRKAQPASEPLPGTFKWMARLPRNVRPVRLLREYPRVTNTLAASWNDPDAFRACLCDLLIDKRGHRRGFPEEVLCELLALRSYFDHSCLR